MPQAKSFDRTVLIEQITHQQVYPLNWDENEGWIEVYVHGHRTKLALDELRTHDGLPVTFPDEPATVVDTHQDDDNLPSF